MVSPNPAEREIRIKTSKNPSRSIAAIRIVDLSGRIVINYSRIDPNQVLDISNIPSGIYLIQGISHNKLTSTQKLVVN
jgi:hypothetical protein